jgi:hypothetical protein
MSDPIADILTDLPAAIALFNALKVAKAALPASPKIVDYAAALGCGAGSVGFQIAALVDAIEAQTKS